MRVRCYWNVLLTDLDRISKRRLSVFINKLDVDRVEARTEDFYGEVFFDMPPGIFLPLRPPVSVRRQIHDHVG